MRLSILIIGLLILLTTLQYQLWLGEEGHRQLQRRVAQQRQKNLRLKAINATLTTEVVALKQELSVVEKRARMELGLIKPGEVYRIVK